MTLVRNTRDRSPDHLSVDFNHGLVLSPDFLLRVALGRVTGATRVAALGFVPDVDAATEPEDVWTNGGLYPWAAASSTFTLVSASASDTATGTGARTVLVLGLDANYAAQTELVPLNGTTPVNLVKSFLRINSMLMMDAGSGETNVGAITLTRVSGAIAQAVIPAGIGITQQAVYTVPAGFTLVIVGLEVSLNAGSGSRTADVSTCFRVLSTNGNRFLRLPRRITATESGPTSIIAQTGITVVEKTDFSLRSTFVSNDNSAITAAWEGVLFDNLVL